jgi:hypothetical protein
LANQLKQVDDDDLDRNVIDLSARPSAYGDWQSCTVEWLCHPQFFSPSACPIMKVGANGVYDSSEECMDTVLRLWIAMTFADGHSALASHCRSKGPNGACQKGIWPIHKKASQASAGLHCRTKNCDGHVRFACRFRNHDTLCASCASKSVEHHLEVPRPQSSTHVYDCTVSRLDPDGCI